MTRLKFLAAVKSHSTITTAPPPNLTLIPPATQATGPQSAVCSLHFTLTAFLSPTMGFLNELPGSTVGHLHLFLRKKMKNPDNAQEGDYAMNILGIESLFS